MVVTHNFWVASLSRISVAEQRHWTLIGQQSSTPNTFLDNEKTACSGGFQWKCSCQVAENSTEIHSIPLEQPVYAIFPLDLQVEILLTF